MWVNECEQSQIMFYEKYNILVQLMVLENSFRMSNCFDLILQLVVGTNRASLHT